MTKAETSPSYYGIAEDIVGFPILPRSLEAGSGHRQDPHDVPAGQFELLVGFQSGQRLLGLPAAASERKGERLGQGADQHGRSPLLGARGHALQRQPGLPNATPGG